MKEIRTSLPSFVLLLAVTAGGAFAAGRAIPAGSPPRATVTQAAAMQEPNEEQEPAPEQLPPGHPPIDKPSSPSPGGTDRLDDTPAPGDVAFEWKVPPRWQVVPNPSPMRLATYRVPRAPGDAEDAELSVTRAGGSADANAERWIHQFDEAGQKTAKRTTRTIGRAEVTIVEVQGAYSGAMGKAGASQPGSALLGAIVSTPGMPYFFKLTGPSKSVLAARGELDSVLNSLAPRRGEGM